jgi:hypothetical protein
VTTPRHGYRAEPHFVTGIHHAEDIAAVPRSRWLIAGGMASQARPQGHLYLVDTDAMTSSELFPADATFALDRDTYGEIEPPALDIFFAHGLALREGEGTVHTLYVVNHGGREAIEVFEVDTAPARPTLTWVGAVEQAPGVLGNAVAPIAGGGVVSTVYMDKRDPDAITLVNSGQISGNLKTWRPGGEWEDVPGSETNAPNGVEVSADGNTYFIASWGARELVRVTVDGADFRRDAIDLEMLPDNVKWSPDGRILVTGQDDATAEEVVTTVMSSESCNFPFHVLAVDPDTLEAEELVRLSHETFGTAATALEVDGRLWVSSARNDRIAWFEPV